ncbi:MAG: hypothetical protein HRU40_03340 [Saprospiraceae bacterium]|nr:hypothetical protein [Saprospiraceae bacterium]
MESRSLILLAFLIIQCSIIRAQKPDVRPRDSNAEIANIAVSDYSLINQLMLPIPGVAADEYASIEAQSVKAYMMPVRRSEKGHLISSYMLASCLEYYVNMEKNYKVNLSPDYIALSLQAQGRDLSLIDAFQFLAEQGTVSAAILPYGAGMITNAVYATTKFRIVHYLHIFRSVTKERQKIFEMRKALMRGHPILVEVLADESLATANGQENWKNRGKNTRVYPLIVVGFDESRDSFEVLSAWGSRWGKGGYLWVSYADMAVSAQNGYVLVP